MRGIGGIEAVPILQRRRAFGGIELDAAAQDLAQLDAGAHLSPGSDLVVLEAGILLLDGRREISRRRVAPGRGLSRTRPSARQPPRQNGPCPGCHWGDGPATE